jgi:hypothetical protein
MMPFTRIGKASGTDCRCPTALAAPGRLAGIVSQEAVPPAARVSAAGILQDRGWGRAPQAHAGEDDKDVRVTIRHITEGRTNGACSGISTAIPQKLPSPPRQIDQAYPPS